VIREKGFSRKIKKRSSFQIIRKDLLDAEIGSVPQKKEALLHIALVYPNSYHVGMASLGFQTVYRLWNEHPRVLCERAFVEDVWNCDDIRTLESGCSVRQFEIIAYSVSFELDILNIIYSLAKARIPLLRTDRIDKDPLVIVGGVVASLNPSPLLPFVDGLLVGEGEGVLHAIADLYIEHKVEKSRRQRLLESFSNLEGMFIPGISKSVQRRHVVNLDSCPVYTPIVTPFSSFKNMFVVETGRGCNRGCLFCAAAKVYAPCRYRSEDSLLETILKKNPGSFRVGLEGAGLSDYPNLESVCERVIQEGNSISFSSIRANRVTPKLVSLLDRGGVRSFTIAPEVGTDRLRSKIGKRMVQQDLMTCIDILADSSIQVIKLYFLIGFENETNEDIISIVQLVKNFSRRIEKKGNQKRIRLAVNAFIPKPFTEFQWSPMEHEKVLSGKRDEIFRNLRKVKNVSVIQKSTREEILQGILSKGNEQVGLAFMDAWNQDISWKMALKKRGIDGNDILHRNMDFNTELPWDFILTTESRGKLWKRYQKFKNSGR
jgi:radical SAM superfamily enzyme YgiQ (UPF0313 family)